MVGVPHPTTKARSALVRMALGPLTVLVLVSTPLGVRVAPAHPADEPHSTLEAFYRSWTDLVGRRESLEPAAFDSAFAVLVDSLFALDSLGPAILERRWKDLNPVDRMRFRRALARAIQHRVMGFTEATGKVPKLSLGDVEASGNAATLQYAVGEGRGRASLAVSMFRKTDGTWRVRDVNVDGQSMEEYYRHVVRRPLRSYSFAYMIARLGDYPYIILEDFESSPTDTLPPGWGWKGSDNDKRKPYRVREENGNKYLEATDRGESVILGKDIKWNLREYPYVSFRWRVHEIPKGGDERFDETVDSAAGIYFVYRRLLGKIPQSVKYVWSSTLPVGSAMLRDGVGKPWMVVADSGTDHLGEWRTYVFNLADAYEKTFGRRPPSKPIGIGVLSDANSTHSHAYADYDDIRALREAPPGVTGGVERILPTNEHARR